MIKILKCIFLLVAIAGSGCTSNKVDQENHFLNAQTAFSNGDHDTAIVEATRSIEQKIEVEDAYLIRGMSWSLLSEHDNAISDLTKVIPVSYTHLTLPTIYSV